MTVCARRSKFLFLLLQYRFFHDCTMTMTTRSTITIVLSKQRIEIEEVYACSTTSCSTSAFRFRACPNHFLLPTYLKQMKQNGINVDVDVQLQAHYLHTYIHSLCFMVLFTKYQILSMYLHNILISLASHNRESGASPRPSERRPIPITSSCKLLASFVKKGASISTR